MPLPPGQLACTVSVPLLHEAARQTVLDDEVASAGQLVEPPLHTSATSQLPLAPRQVLVSSVQVPLEQL